MTKLHNPKVFINHIEYYDHVGDRMVKRAKVVESKTSDVRIPYNGPLSSSFRAERDPETGKVSNASHLSIDSGETKEFTEDEATFLLKRYPFLQRVGEDEAMAKEPVAAPIPDLGGEEEVPTNFMKLKKYAKEKGVKVEKTDKKPDLLAKLAELNS